jgi:ubiquinone/menaquinone biosynthesis C-methylase UbiE
MKNKTIAKQYNDFHEVYSEQLSEQNELSNQMFHNALDFNVKDKKILDIGCGDGSALKLLSDKGALTYGVDPSEEFIKAAQAIDPSGSYTTGIGETLPFQDGTFDIVTSKWALQTSAHVPKILSEAARVLKPGGILVILTKHPLMQWREKIRDYGHGADYYEQKIVTSNIYGGSIVLKEPSHTFSEYFSKEFFTKFEMIDYQEATEFPASEQFDNDIYPTFFIMKARRK